MDKILQEQIAYYRARATEYDEWFLRQGRYDYGQDHREGWFRDVEEVEQALDSFAPTGNTLEIAGGTGWWTEKLAPHAEKITVVDASSEILSINKQKLAAFQDKMHYIESDIFSWQAPEHYDVIFFSFWLSHVPAERFDSFWQMLSQILKTNGRVFFVDSRFHNKSAANNHYNRSADKIVEQRHLNDGRSFNIVKVYYQATELAQRLEALGWQSKIQETDQFFLHGTASYNG